MTLLLHAWPDIEEALIKEAEEATFGGDYVALVDALRQAFRVEAHMDPNEFLPEMR
jgi:hypothetical protein